MPTYHVHYALNEAFGTEEPDNTNRTNKMSRSEDPEQRHYAHISRLSSD